MNIDLPLYLRVRQEIWDRGYMAEWTWAQNVQPPATADEFLHEALWIICCSGFREQAARLTQARVLNALKNGRSATDVFPTSAKGRAIDTLCRDRHNHFQRFRYLLRSNAVPEEVISWIGSLPFVGGRILRYHFAKNLGIDCAKPDRWLCRLAGIPENSPIQQSFGAAMNVCRPLAIGSGDRIATVDLILWRACNLGLLAP